MEAELRESLFRTSYLEDLRELTRFLIQDSAGRMVSPGKPAFHRGEVPKWSDSDLGALIRCVCRGKLSQ